MQFGSKPDPGRPTVAGHGEAGGSPAGARLDGGLSNRLRPHGGLDLEECGGVVVERDAQDDLAGVVDDAVDSLESRQAALGDFTHSSVLKKVDGKRDRFIPGLGDWDDDDWRIGDHNKDVVG